LRSLEQAAAGVAVEFCSKWNKIILILICTNAARTISTVGGSLRDVQMLAGHRALSTTQRYIEADVEAQRRVVDLV
jgi:hypothetical protein